MHVISVWAHFSLKICQNCDPTATNKSPFWLHFYTVTNDVLVQTFSVFRNSTYELRFSRSILQKENYTYKKKHSSPTNLHVAQGYKDVLNWRMSENKLKIMIAINDVSSWFLHGIPYLQQMKN